MLQTTRLLRLLTAASHIGRQKRNQLWPSPAKATRMTRLTARIIATTVMKESDQSDVTARPQVEERVYPATRGMNKMARGMAWAPNR